MSTHASSKKKSGKSASRAQRNYSFRAYCQGNGLFGFPLEANTRLKPKRRSQTSRFFAEKHVNGNKIFISEAFREIRGVTRRFVS
jgi:hypothetical protein